MSDTEAQAGLSEPLFQVPVVVVPGYQVASGNNGDPRFPGGTLRMQLEPFRERGLDLQGFYLGTVNVSLTPWRYRVVRPRLTYRAVRWHPEAPAEDFSFFDATVIRTGHPAAVGFVYYPHPETKPEHFQRDDVLELLLPWQPELKYGDSLMLSVPVEQMMFVSK